MADEGSESPSKPTQEEQVTQGTYQDIFQDALERVARLDSNAQFLSVNKQFAELFGYLSSEMIGMSLSELCSTEDCSKSIDLFVEMKAMGRSEGVFKANTKSGDEFFLKVVLMKGLQKTDSLYFCYCFIDLVNPSEIPTEASIQSQQKSDLSQSYVPSKVLKEHGQLQSLLNGLNAVFWECSYPDFKYTFIGDSLSHVLGYSGDDWLGSIKFNSDFIHPEDLQGVLDICLASIKQGKDFEINYRIKNKHKQYVWLQENISLIKDENQNVYRLRGVSVDISTNKVEEQVANNSRKRIFKIFDSIPSPVFAIQLNDGIVTKINPAFTHLTGYEKEDILGRNILDVNLFSDATFRNISEKLKSEGRFQDKLVEYRNKLEQKDSMTISSIMVVDEKIPYIFSIVTTEQHPSVKELPAGNVEIEDIQKLCDALSISVSCFDAELNLKFFNDAYSQEFNATNRFTVGQSLKDIVGNVEFEKISNFITKARNGRHVQFQYAGSGSLAGKFYEVTMIPKMGSNNELIEIYIVSNDITQKRNSQYAEHRLGKILEQSLSEFFVFDIDKRQFTYANYGARENIGYDLNELKVQPYINILPEFSDEKIQSIINRLQSNESEPVSINTIISRKDRSAYSADINIQYSEINSVKELIFLVKDVSMQKETETSLKRVDDALALVEESILFLDKDFTILYANKIYLDMFQCSKNFIENKKMDELWDTDLFNSKIKPFLEKSLEGQIKQDKLRVTLPNGESDISILYSPSRSSDNSINGVVLSIRDVSVSENLKNVLAQNEERFRLIAMATNDSLYDWDLINKRVWRNDKDFANLYSSSELEDWLTVIHPKDRDLTYESFRSAISQKENYWNKEYRLKQIDGRYITVNDRAYIMYDDSKKPIRVMGSMTDITDKKKVEQALKTSEERFRALYQDNPLMLFNLDKNGIILSLNNHVTSQLGYFEVDILGETIYSIIDKAYIDNVNSCINNALAELGAIQNVEFEKKLKTGGNIWVRYTVRSIKDNVNDELRVLIVCEDISENKRLSEQLSYQASHDSLTGLVNRAEFERRLERVLSSKDKDTAHHALCYLDLDQFKIVNDTCGHLAGDELLRQISGILSNAVRKRDTLARLGGDEFGILMEHCTLEQAQRVANEMRKYIEEFRYIWEGKRFILGVSIGLVPISPGENKSLNSILREADVACYAAKDAGRNRVHIYTPDDPEISGKHGQVQWAAIINQALDEERFVLYHQAIENISPFNKDADGERFEILLRMQDEEGKLITPSSFMPSAERYNLAVKIDTWVFNQVLEWMTSNTHRLDDIKMCSINISGHSMNNIQYLDSVLQKLYETNIPPHKICFEITETAAISNISTALSLMQTIKSVGCMFALDDFGSGVSSFAYLKQLPVDYLKIDGSFVRDIAEDQVDYEMVRSIKDVAGVMGMKTIAEFVETQEIKQKLHEIGIDYGQGYCIAEPKILQ